MATEVVQHQHPGLASHSAWNYSLATPNHPPDGELIRGEAATIASPQVPPVDHAEARSAGLHWTDSTPPSQRLRNLVKWLEYPVQAGVVRSMNEVTRILSAIEAGDPQAAAHLLPLVYYELRKLAAARLADEKPGQTLQPTALVHEAYLRLVGPADDQRWESRGHFFAAAAEAMRRILVENARRKMRKKRGGERVRLDMDAVAPAAPPLDEDLLDLDDALTRLAGADPAAAELVKLRYFAGLSIPQAAEALGVGARSADRLWAYARAWLRDALSGS
jgi:RNA polymerase sigma factor (TIGR02999 family)